MYELLKVLAARQSEYFTAWMGRSHIPAYSLTCPPKLRLYRVKPARLWSGSSVGAMPHLHVSSGVCGIWDGGVMSWRATDLAEDDAMQQAADPKARAVAWHGESR